MFWPVLIVAAGLLVALAGMVITFIICPPIYQFDWDAGVIGTAAEEAKREKMDKRKVEWSKGGVWLLASGTFLQLVGTIWQVVMAACRK
jgi:hypothetical protein